MPETPSKKINRRNFLIGSLVSIAGSTPIIGTGNRSSAETLVDKPKFNIRPDCLKYAEEINIQITNPKKEDLVPVLEQLGSIFEVLPTYTNTKNPQIRLLVDKEAINSPELKKFLLKYNERIGLKVIIVDSVSPFAQDSGKYIEINGEICLLVPNSVKMRNTSSLEASEDRVLSSSESTKVAFSSNEKIITTPFYFEGGDIREVMNTAGEKYLFIGSDTLSANMRILSEETENKSKSQHELFLLAKKMILDFFAGVNVEFLPDEIPFSPNAENINKLFFHTDQSVLPLIDGNVVVATINENENFEYLDKETSDYFSKIRARQNRILKRLSELGFKTHTLEHKKVDLELNLYYLNAFPYINKENGNPEIIIPSYMASMHLKGTLKTINEPEDFREDSRNLALYKILSSLDYKVTMVMDKTPHTALGSVNCRILAKN